MPRLVRPLLLVLALVGAASPLPAAPNLTAISAFEKLPVSNPYRAPLLRLESLPDADRTALKAWHNHLPESDEPTPTLTADQQALVAELRQSLIETAANTPLDSCAWPLETDPKNPFNPASLIIEGIGSRRELARLAVKSADGLPADQAIDTYAAIAQMGRQQRAGRTLIEQLTGVAIESIALHDAARRLDEYSPEGLAKLSDALTALHAPPSNAEALAGERDVFFLPVLERVIVPGLHALLADPAAAGDSEKTDDSDADENPFHDLRLSGLVRIGPGDEQVSIENTATGETITLRPGRPVEGLELVSIDFEQHRALLRRGDHEALVDLRTKRVTDLARAARHLREMYRGFDILSGEGKGEAALAEALALVRAHPEGVDGYARDLLARYQAGIDRQLSLADSPVFPPSIEEAPSDDPLLALTMPTLGRVCRTFNHAATYPAIFQAAIHHRLARAGVSSPRPAPADPWSEDGAAFSAEETPDGGLILRSRYEAQPGAPLTYKFAAPDAGYQRPSP